MSRIVTALLVLLALPSVYGEWPAFERLRLRVDVDNRGDRSYIKLPAIVSEPSSRWIKFFLDATIDTTIIGAHVYTPSKTLKLAGINTTTNTETWEDTWYFDRSASSLRFVLSRSGNTSVIALGPNSDIWTAFTFVEFCPFMGEIYFHRRPLSPETLVCLRGSRPHTPLQCKSAAECKWHVTDLDRTRNSTLWVSPALTEEAMREQVPPYYFPTLSMDLTITKGGAFRFSDSPHVFAYCPGKALLGFSVTDEISTQSPACLALGLLLFGYMYYIVHTHEYLSLAITRTHASFVIFLAGYMHHNLMIGDKLRYMLITYDLWNDNLSIDAIDWTCILIPSFAAGLLVLDVHQSRPATTITQQSYRGILITLTTLLPSFFFLLISFERINILVMVFVGTLATSALVRDITVAIFNADRNGVNFFLYFLTWTAAIVPLPILYPITFIPLVSEILLQAAAPYTVARVAIVVHVIVCTVLTICANPPAWLQKVKTP